MTHVTSARLHGDCASALYSTLDLVEAYARRSFRQAKSMKIFDPHGLEDRLA